jgi:hypothetical protein
MEEKRCVERGLSMDGVAMIALAVGCLMPSGGSTNGSSNADLPGCGCGTDALGGVDRLIPGLRGILLASDLWFLDYLRGEEDPVFLCEHVPRRRMGRRTTVGVRYICCDDVIPVTLD